MYIRGGQLITNLIIFFIFELILTYHMPTVSSYLRWPARSKRKARSCGWSTVGVFFLCFCETNSSLFTPIEFSFFHKLGATIWLSKYWWTFKKKKQGFCNHLDNYYLKSPCQAASQKQTQILSRVQPFLVSSPSLSFSKNITHKICQLEFGCSRGKLLPFGSTHTPAT